MDMDYRSNPLMYDKNQHTNIRGMLTEIISRNEWRIQDTEHLVVESDRITQVGEKQRSKEMTNRPREEGQELLRVNRPTHIEVAEGGYCSVMSTQNIQDRLQAFQNGQQNQSMEWEELVEGE